MPRKEYLPFSRAALPSHKLEWLEHWGRLAELELKWSTRELMSVDLPP